MLAKPTAAVDSADPSECN
jgi:hypothetical protein